MSIERPIVKKDGAGVILFLSPGLGAQLIYRELIATYPDIFLSIYELPTIPTDKKGSGKSKYIIKKLRSSSIKYLFFNFVTIKLFNLVGSLFSHTLESQAKDSGIKYSKVESFDNDFLRSLEDQRPAYIINASSIIIKKDLINIPSCGILNYHCAPLPQYRGAANYFWLLIEDEVEAYATLHYVDEGLDTGDIIAKSSSVIIDDKTSVYGLWFSLRIQAFKTFKPLVDSLRVGVRLNAIPQDNSLANVRSFPQAVDIEKLKKDRRVVFKFYELINIFHMAITGSIGKR